MNIYRCWVIDRAYGFTFPMNVLAEDRSSAFKVIQAHTRFEPTELIELINIE